MTNLQVLGRSYVEALARRDFTSVESYLHPQVTFQALIPSGLERANDAAGALVCLRNWFSDADELTILQQTSDDSLGCLALSYRFLMHTQDEWQVVMQHAFCRVSDGRIMRLHLVCSGFWPVESPHSAGQMRRGETVMPDTPEETLSSHPLPYADAVLDAAGEGCATLTPLIRSRMKELESGQILDVRTDDPTAHESLLSWCALTGHTLAAVGADDAQGKRFLIRKK
jgi:TusA-related sulfurtransferase